MTSIFNPEEFLNRAHEGNFSTKRPTVPPGEYPAQLADGKDGMDIRTIPVEGVNRFVLSLGWNILDETAKTVTGMDNPRVKQDIWLDLDAEGRLINDKTHNVDLGKLLSALGLNTQQVILSQLRTVGLCKVRVTEEPDKKKSNPDGTPIIYNRVTAVTKYNGG